MNLLTVSSSSVLFSMKCVGMSFSQPALWLRLKGRVIMRRNRLFLESFSFFVAFCSLWVVAGVACNSDSEASVDESHWNDSLFPEEEETLSKDFSQSVDPKESIGLVQSWAFVRLILRSIIRCLQFCFTSLTSCFSLIAHFSFSWLDKSADLSLILFPGFASFSAKSSVCSLKSCLGFVKFRTKSLKSVLICFEMGEVDSSKWTPCKKENNLLTICSEKREGLFQQLPWSKLMPHLNSKTLSMARSRYSKHAGISPIITLTWIFMNSVTSQIHITCLQPHSSLTTWWYIKKKSSYNHLRIFWKVTNYLVGSCIIYTSTLTLHSLIIW